MRTIVLKLLTAMILAIFLVGLALGLLAERTPISRANPLAGGTVVGSNITTNTIWSLAGSPYTLTADITVNSGITLTVEPGVVVRAQDDVGLVVYGHLEAAGTAAQPITLTSAADNGPGQWAGLRIAGDYLGQGSARLEYVTLRYWGDHNTDTYAGIAILSNKEVTLNHSQILSGSASGTDYGLHLNNEARLTLSDTVIAGNGNATTDAGLYIAHIDYGRYVTITNSLFRANAGYGLNIGAVYDTELGVTISNSHFEANGGYPVRLPASWVPRFLAGGNTFSGNTPNRLLFTCCHLTEDTTFSRDNGLDGYEIESTTTVATGVVLTITPGVTVYARDGQALFIYGRLEARGTVTNPITFTSALDSEPGPGQWEGQWNGLRFGNPVSVSGSGHLEYVTVRYWGDSYNGNSAGVAVNNSADEVTIAHSRIISGGQYISEEQYGLYVNNSRVSVTASLIADSDDYGVFVPAGANIVTITNSIIQDNSWPAQLRVDDLPALLNGGNVITNNSTNRLRIAPGTATRNVTLAPFGSGQDYEVASYLGVSSGVTLTVAPGATVYVGGGAYGQIDVDGHLEAVGSYSRPITFTSLTGGEERWTGLDFGGSGNLDYVTVKLWGYRNGSIGAGLRVNGSGPVKVNHSHIVSGGGNDGFADYGIYAYNGPVIISDTLIDNVGDEPGDHGLMVVASPVTVTGSCLINNAGHGVYLGGYNTPSFLITGSDISGNGEGGLTVTASIPATVTATGNWWGDASGPAHPGNPTGFGQRVSNYVDYADWQPEPICQSYLRLAKQGPDTALAGQPLTYTLTVFNRSPVTATNVALIDKVPAGATVAAVLDGGGNYGSEVIWSIPEIPANGSVQARFVVSAAASIINQTYWAETPDGSMARGLYPLETTIVRSGSGEFVAGQLLGASNSRAVALRDLDGDGDLDAVVANASPDQVWLNTGNGTFNPGQALGNDTSQAIDLDDLNGDALPDIVVGNTGVNAVWLNNGNGTFSQLPGFGSGNNQALALGDLNGDGFVDAFVGNSAANQIWLNDGSGHFTADFTQTPGSGSQAAALADFDADGDLDAAVGTATAGEIWLNNGSGVFTVTTTLGSGNAQAIALGDLNTDGHIDVVLGLDSGQQVWLGDGSGAFNPGPVFGSSNSQALALGDFDADGDLDIFVGTDSSQGNRVWLNDGRGNFNDSGQSFAGSDSTGVAVGDLDGDGDLDVVVVNANGQAGQVYLNRNQPVTEVGPDGGVMTDVNQGLTTTITIPAGLLAQSTTFTLTEKSSPTPPVSATLRFGQRAFTLVARQNDLPLTGPFAPPLTMTLYFSTTGLVDPNNLTLRYRDEAQQLWLDVADTCSPPSTYLRASGVLTVAVCHLTEFALFEPNRPPAFNVTGSPLLTPTLGTVLTTPRPSFEWAAASDDVGGPITYTLTLTGSTPFTGVALLAATTVVTVTQPIFTPTVDLPAAAYTWTVCAWDAAGLPGQFITPATFAISAGGSDHTVFLPVIFKKR